MRNLPFSSAGRALLLAVLLGFPIGLRAQAPAPAEGPMLTQPAVLGMMGLLLIIFTRAMVLLVGRVAALVRSTQKPSTENEAGRFDETVTNLSDAQLDAILARREGR